MDRRQLVARAARVVPSARQLAWQRREFMAFIHFGPNTFTGRQWGTGRENPAVFAPTAFDAGQWARVCLEGGMRELILTAKHHDGFCLWPSEWTDHSVRSSPWRGGRGDMVGEVSDACRRAGLAMGIYLSPWDMHEPSYGSAAYNDYFVRQLTELLTNYGPVAEVWFDGACGEGPNGKRQVYDWPRYYGVVRRLQPDAVISVMGPDVRWCGNEAGHVRESEWSVVSSGSADPGLVAALSQQADLDGVYVPDIDPRAEDLGSVEQLARAERLVWYPAQVNTSIRPRWFYDPADDGRVKSLDHLLHVYLGSVGGNATFLLNLPPDQRGLIHEVDAARMRELGRILQETFRHDLALHTTAVASNVRDGDPRYGAQRSVDGDPETYWMADDGVAQAAVTIDLGREQTFNVALLQEQIQVGQRVELFALDALDGASGEWRIVSQGTVIGYKRLLRFAPTVARHVRVRILGARVCPTLSRVGLFWSPALARKQGETG